MKSDNRKIKRIPPITQGIALKKAFPETIETKVNFNKFTWKFNLKPTIFSIKYGILLELSSDKLSVFVVQPSKLELHPNEEKLPHVYNTTSQKLCLFYPNNKEWNKGKLLIDTVVPWISEWLFFYEIWLITGEWFGEGTHSKINE